MPKREKYTTLVFSTAHITRKDSEILDESARGQDSGVETTFYGWRIWCPSEMEYMLEREQGFKKAGASPQMLRLIREARRRKCLWVEFDRDGEVFKDLEEYNW